MSESKKGTKLSEETKEKLKEKISGRNNPMYGVSRLGKDNPMWGKNHSNEAKMKMSKNINTLDIITCQKLQKRKPAGFIMNIITKMKIIKEKLLKEIQLKN